MSIFTLSIILLVLLFVLLGAGVWIAFALLGVGMAAMALYSSAPLGLVMATTVWGNSNSWALAALPLFIWMGEILFRSKLSDDMFAGLSPWMNRLPGRLLHVNIFGCGIFAAVSGSSAATAATIGKLSIPELSRRGYPERMIIGTLAGSATLGLLIPPSIILIVYGVATEQSIARLFIAGVLPGILLVALFVGYVAIWSLLNRKNLPDERFDFSLREKLHHSRRLLPVVLLIGGVIGSIYAGVATPTESAGLGVVAALGLAAVRRRISWRMLADTCEGTMRTTAMIMAILIAAYIVNFVITTIGLSGKVTTLITSLGLSPTTTMIIIVLFYLVLGMFMESLSMMVATVPVITPVVITLGFNPVWFGVLMMLLIETALITPPVGFNLFVVQGVRPRGQIYDVIIGASPFVITLMLMIALLLAYPQVALWLPHTMAN